MVFAQALVLSEGGLGMFLKVVLECSKGSPGTVSGYPEKTPDFM